MPYSGLSEFIKSLEKAGELCRIKVFADPVLEITEITDRVTSSGGKALLFENNGTHFPLLINAYGSVKRMALATGGSDPGETVSELIGLFDELTVRKGKLIEKIRSLSALLRISGYLPSVMRRKGSCQQVIHRDPDLGILPVLKCWPHDAGRFITLPVVHTVHPFTGKTNAGMYRMQVLDKNRTAMHWQRHKTGASHFEEWKKTGKRMPVTVTLGGDPVYAYAATAPLPENIDEYILAGLLRKKKVRMVKCLTNELLVPSDADIVIEGYVYPSEKPVLEGPFGDHTGFYSLADWYPVFHVTCITHRKQAVYPATIVGIPPQEDAWLTRATEKIFLAPVKLALQPETEDFHMPDAGVAHNLVIVRIRKRYPGQGKKVISSLFGAGQMMFSKYLIVVSGEVDIRNYRKLMTHVLENTNFRKDLLFSEGPLDVLDHASDISSAGGKLGIDATIKPSEESVAYNTQETFPEVDIINELKKFNDIITSWNLPDGLPVIVAGIRQYEDSDAFEKAKEIFSRPGISRFFRLVLIVDDTVDVKDWFIISWQILANSDPGRDLFILPGNTVLIDGTIKAFRKEGFTREWPNIVCSDQDTIKSVDRIWDSLGIGTFITSPSKRNSGMLFGNDASVKAIRK